MKGFGYIAVAIVFAALCFRYRIVETDSGTLKLDRLTGQTLQYLSDKEGNAIVPVHNDKNLTVRSLF